MRRTATAAVVLAAALLTACTAPAGRPAARDTPAASGASAVPTPSPTPSPSATAVPVGAAGTYQVSEQQMTFAEPARGGHRTLITDIWYPRQARGPFPLLLFAPGFMLCASTYGGLVRSWASAGYVVAAVNFPRTSCRARPAAYEADLVNQPGDVSYVLTRLLALSGEPGNTLTGLLNHRQIGAAGHSDGGDTVAALAGNTCCADPRLKAVAVLSGAEWPPMPGRYFADGAPPMLFVQGSADTINPPWASRQLYQADHAKHRYYLDLFGVTHMTPYAGTNRVERLVARVTLAFFDRYLLGQAGAAAAMQRYGNVSGTASLVSGGHLPP